MNLDEPKWAGFCSLRQHIESNFKTPHFWIGRNKITGCPGVYIDFIKGSGWSIQPQHRIARWLDRTIFMRWLPIETVINSIYCVLIDADIVGQFPDKDLIPIHRGGRFDDSCLDCRLEFNGRASVHSDTIFNMDLRRVDNHRQYQADVSLLSYIEHVYVEPNADGSIINQT